ncbi:DgyrCDS12321 [Dimorphilus gyrociliatus]|uniref:DgyrCDS12321 n=1 Tax=Dimorphilus gyrociliatus TaxID=2664684 RepID=A0A7I8W646_9ANNE|nr:DgyrCDS12321 [Dimorphilus gyrociliatus]
MKSLAIILVCTFIIYVNCQNNPAPDQTYGSQQQTGPNHNTCNLQASMAYGPAKLNRDRLSQFLRCINVRCGML